MMFQTPTAVLGEHNLVPLCKEHLQTVWQWRNSQRVRSNMHNADLISHEEHLDWFNALQNDLTRQSWIYCQHQRPVGLLNFTDVLSKHVQWGGYLGETDVLPGSGLVLEWAALQWASTYTHCVTLDAQVLSFNISALKLHQLFEYKLVKTQAGGIRPATDNQPKLSYTVHFFSYPVTQWSDNSIKVLAKLPKPLQRVMQQIQFLPKE
jgi:UDP-4-amino-4,6-dideoxy-N-acetyl-beta-L-altrosamine N-acetyltransferase